VFNNKTKQTLTGAAVDITTAEPKPAAMKSDASGKFTARMPELQEYSINVSQAGFQPYSDKFKIGKINSDTIINVEIFLNPDAKSLVINGLVTNKKTGDPVDAKVLISRKGDMNINFNPTTTNGAFSQEVPKTGLYLFTTSREGFLNSIDSLDYSNNQISPMNKNIALQPIEVGVVVRLKNIYFDFTKATLKTESFVELEKVVVFLNENPTVEIEIEGHTDSVGPDDRNLKLSQDRSQSVVDYIVSKGISKDRLTAKGFGETKPIDTNDTDSGRANNRRVEFTVLKT
jgi:OmpA-OmpF porin, OOP family